MHNVNYFLSSELFSAIARSNGQLHSLAVEESCCKAYNLKQLFSVDNGVVMCYTSRLDDDASDVSDSDADGHGV